MRFGLGLPQQDHFDLAHDVVAVARAAEAAGYDSVWVYERVLFPVAPRDGLYGVDGVPWPERYRSCADPLVTLSLAAAVTERVRLGGSVLVAPLHTPVQLARQLATLDLVSGGRVVAGFGLGWSTDEYRAAGVDFAARAAALDEVIAVCRAVWGPNPVSHHGPLADIDEAVFGPKPAGEIPIYLGALSERALDRLARVGDGWAPALMPPSALAGHWAWLRTRAESYGRDPDALGFTLRAPTLPRPTAVPEEGRAPFSGSVAQIAADVVAYGEIGVREVLLEFQSGVRDGAELVDTAGTLREGLRAEGL